MDFVRTDLSKNFADEIKGFLTPVQILEVRAKALETVLRKVSVEISMRSSGSPILPQSLHEESCDYSSEGQALIAKIDRLLGNYSTTSSVMAPDAAKVAEHRLETINKQIDAFRDRHAESGTVEVWFFPNDDKDYREEVGDLPFLLTRQFLLDRPADPAYKIEKVTVFWQKPSEEVLKNALMMAEFKFWQNRTDAIAKGAPSPAS